MSRMHLNKQESNNDKEPSGYTVHHILAQSYSFYFLLFLISFLLDLAFPVKIFNNSVMTGFGLLFLILASILIIWAQKASRAFNNAEHVKTETFCNGPYCYTRTPTHWGLFFLILGFGIIINAFFVILATLISFIVSKLVFLKKEEMLMEGKYGAPYKAYKKLVRF